MKATFFGVSTILFEHGDSRILIDGFFSRPSSSQLLRFSPNETRIRACLSRAGITELDAIFVAHSHHDHAMDIARVARILGDRTTIYGSESTANIARGDGLPDSHIVPVYGGETFSFGPTTLHVLESEHAPHPPIIGRYIDGAIEKPLIPPNPFWAYKVGIVFSFLIEASGHRILVHPSSRTPTDLYQNTRADLVFLGIGRLGKQSTKYIRNYWHETVQKTGATKVALIHWDDFMRPLDRGLKPFKLIDNYKKSINTLRHLGDRDQVELLVPQAFEILDFDT